MFSKPAQKKIIVTAFSLFGIACALAVADRANPPDMTRYQTLSPEVVASNGTLLRPFLSKDGYWRLKTEVREVNPRYLKILKAYEDKHFDEHFGVDPAAVIRAAVQYLTAGRIVSGASTLSMQAARLLEPPRPRGLVTKALQMVRAVQLEERYSKDQILSIYLTLAPFGGNLEGVRAAALAYFNKEPEALDLSESAVLVALPQSPARLRPDRHGLAAIAGRKKVLDRMVAEGVISASDAAVAEHEGVPSIRLAMPLIAPHLAYHLAQQAKATHIQTTIDANLQQAIERLAAQESAYFDDHASLAIVVVENRTRNVLAYVGGTDYWGKNGQIDLARRSRSPGSALKPFIYGLAFDDLILHPSTMMEDQATIFGDYAPHDFSGGFVGAVTARDALRMSLNVPAVMVLDRVGPLRFTLALQNAGARLAFPTKDMPSLPVALGGLGISLADMAMLYTGIADRGIARPLRYVKYAPSGERHKLFGPVAAYYLRQILAGVALPEGWAMGQGLSKQRTIAFKTGTSYGFRDAWSAGFSNDYTVAVWVGRADGAPRVGSVGREAAGPILLKTFGLLPKDRTPDPAPPTGTILAASTDALPPGLRVFTREIQQAAVPVPTHVPPPTISFPPNGATVPLPPAGAKDKDIQLKADGGSGPLTWLVNGRLIGSFDRFQPVLVSPPGEGFARIVVVDASGRSDASEVRFKHLR
ncbi:MAG: penicillin-binding protein 1C [Proteobacteria bacterium]|nr:penicillin-binding protein 1C [Pseudomonadota bacterium]